MNFQLRSMDFHSQEWLRVEANQKPCQSRWLQGTNSLPETFRSSRQLWKGKLHPRQWNLTELFVLSSQTDFLVRLLVYNYGLLPSFSVFSRTLLSFICPLPFQNISFSLFWRMIRPWPPLLNWPLVEPATFLELQRSHKSWKCLCLVLANNSIKDMIWTCPLYFRT